MWVLVASLVVVVEVGARCLRWYFTWRSWLRRCGLPCGGRWYCTCPRVRFSGLSGGRCYFTCPPGLTRRLAFVPAVFDFLHLVECSSSMVAYAGSSPLPSPSPRISLAHLGVGLPWLDRGQYGCRVIFLTEKVLGKGGKHVQTMLCYLEVSVSICSCYSPPARCVLQGSQTKLWKGPGKMPACPSNGNHRPLKG